MKDDTLLEQAILEIDDVLGEGYAKKNPALVAATLNANALVYSAEIVCTAVDELKASLGKINMTDNTQTPPPEITPADIYAIYPRKVARGAAITAIQRAIKKLPPADLLERVKAYAKAVSDWPESELNYCPHCSTWMNQERWDDDPKEWQRTEKAPPPVQKPQFRREETPRYRITL